jgi:hypothetical protein
MADSTPAGAHKQPRRIEFRLRNSAVLHADLLLRHGQALAPWLTTRPGSVNLHDVVWVDTAKRIDQLTLASHEIVWARPLTSIVPLSNVMTQERAAVRVEIAVVGGLLLSGRLPLLHGQPVSEFLASAGMFPILWDARLPDDSVLGDIVVNQATLRSVRPLELTGQAFWERTTPAAVPPQRVPDRAASSERAASPSAPESLHWLVALARCADLPGVGSLVVQPTRPVADVWEAVSAAAGIRQGALARLVAARLRLPVAADLVGTTLAEQAVPRGLAERWGVRGISDDGRVLTVATADPMNADAEQALALACKRRIAFAISTPAALNLVVADDAEAELDQLLAGLPELLGDVVSIGHELDPQSIKADDISSAPIIKLANGRTRTSS